MNIIKIKQLSLENFKCHGSLTIDFMGRDAAIYGDNATGKTSVYDALTWLLFGKDSRGNGEKNIEIKPLDSMGEVIDHHGITTVEAVLTVNGTEISLRRTLQEIWSTKRGSTEPTYDGNTSEYFIDGVPCKKYAFTEKVDELVSEDIFRMLTSVGYFANDIPWQERRNVLFNVAGTMDERQILATREDFKPFVDAMGSLSLDDYKKKLLSDKKRYVGVRDETPARIDECQKTINDLKEIDYEAAEREVKLLSAQKEELSAQLLKIEHNNAIETKNMELKQAQLELDELEAKNRIHREKQMQAKPDTAAMKKKLASLQPFLVSDQNRLENHRGSIRFMDMKIANRREEWIKVSGETFTVGNCPTCGQAMPADRVAEIKADYEATKQKRLHEIEHTADELKKMRASTMEQIELCERDIEERKKEIAALEAEISAADSIVIEVHDMDGYKDTAESLQAWITQLQKELFRLREDAYTASKELRDKIPEINIKISEAMAVGGKKAALGYAEERIENLRAEAKAAAEVLSVIEGQLFLIDEFTRYKTTFVEGNINSLFRIARFRLFREQANGGIEDRCDVVYDGVPYISVNSGTKINLGIDIINTLSRFYGVSVPLFVDNAESVTNLEAAECQIIRLVVSEKDKELRVNYEG